MAAIVVVLSGDITDCVNGSSSGAPFSFPVAVTVTDVLVEFVDAVALTGGLELVCAAAESDKPSVHGSSSKMATQATPP